MSMSDLDASRSDVDVVIGAVARAIDAIRTRPWWTASSTQEAFRTTLEREKSDLSGNRHVFAFLADTGLNVGASFAGMVDSIERIRRLAVDVEESAQAIDAGIWEELDALLNRHNGLVSTAVFERNTSHPTIPVPDHIAVQILSAERRREEAFTVFNQLRSMSEALVRKDDESRDALANAEKADAARRQAQTVAATGADVALSREFGNLATKESESARRWTWSSIGATAAGLVGSVVTHAIVDPGPDTTAFVYPVIVALAAAGLATYFARLGGHHRHTAQWAKSIEVQLDSYARFIEHTPEAERSRVFEQFAGRVLGAPPPRSEKAAVQSATIADIAAIATRNA